MFLVVAALAATGAASAVAPAAAAPRSASPASNYAVIATIATTFSPRGVAVSNDDTVYVTVDGTGDDTTVVINPGSLEVDGSIPVGRAPEGVAVSSDDTVYVGNVTSKPCR